MESAVQGEGVKNETKSSPSSSKGFFRSSSTVSTVANMDAEAGEQLQNTEVRVLSLTEICTSSRRHKEGVFGNRRHIPLWEGMVFDAIPGLKRLRVGDHTQA